eukprot:PhF_6_TR2195/c0_g1_i2/m.3637
MFADLNFVLSGRPYSHVRYLSHGAHGSCHLISKNNTTTTPPLPCVLKLIPLHLEDDRGGQTLRAALREVEVMMSVTPHHHLVQLLEHWICVNEEGEEGESYGYLCLVLEYCVGGDLSQRRKKCTPLTSILTIANGIAHALTTLHAHNIVHRDIKPSNIYYDNTDSEDVKVGDFGVSCVLGTGRTTAHT